MISNPWANQAKPMPASGGGNSLQLALEVSELRYRRLFETAQDGILVLNANTGKIIDVNPFLLDLLEYSFENMIGLRLWEIGQFEDIAANQAAFGALQANEYIRYENLPLRTRTGKEIQVEFVSNVYFAGTHKVIQCNIRDITARAERRDNCDTRLAALELANRTKDAWLIAHSRNLRSRLSSMASMLGLMELGHKLASVRPPYEQSSPFDKAACRHLRRNFQQLVHFFNEVSELSGQGPLQIESNQPAEAKIGMAAPITSANGK
jgi:PAS domain S-box-containing protein